MIARPLAVCLCLAMLPVGLGWAQTGSAASKPIRIALLGQSIIEHDLRQSPDSKARLATLAPKLRGHDIIFTNLEVAIRGRHGGEATRNDTFFHGAEPVVLDCLSGLGVNLVSLANNHAWDYGDAGIRSTIAELADRKIAASGAGENLKQALAPAMFNASGVRIALVASTTSGHAASASPGVNFLDFKRTAMIDANLGVIREASRNADVVIVYEHWQGAQGSPISQQQWARMTIEAGASIYVSHGEPKLSAVEIYRRRPIFLGLGNFIFQTKTAAGHYGREAWEGVIASLTWRGRHMVGLEFHPIVLNESGAGKNPRATRGVPALASKAEGRALLERFRAMSPGVKPQLQIREPDGVLEFKLPGR